MNTPTSKDLVYGIVAQVSGKPESSLSPDARLKDLMDDSIQLFELVLKLEEIFPNPRPNYEALMEIKTVGEAVDYVQKTYYPHP